MSGRIACCFWTDLHFADNADALKQFFRKKGAFQDKKMSKSAKAQVDELLARESHQLQEQKIHNNRAAIEVHVYGVEKVTTTR